MLYMKIKRLIDIILSFIGLIILLPIFSIIAIAIKIDSKGPILFKQKRVGIHKSHFYILKFRTMRIDTPKDTPTHMIRAPMVYGPNCPGNYTRLKKLVMKTPVFPLINNKRSMIFIDNLSEFIRLLIDNQEKGLFFPQNNEYVNTSELIRLIAKKNSKKIYFSRILTYVTNFFGKKISVFNKVFGNLVFDLDLSSYRDFKYCVVDLEKSVEICEKE